jgi:putative ABC transport system permease protein
MLWNSLLLAIREIRRNVLRSALTILGIVIGVAAVIIMVTLGRGATASVTADIESLGSNTLYLRPGERGHAPGGVRAAAKPFTMQDLEAIKREIDNVTAVAPLASKSVLAVYGNANWSPSVTGTDNNYFTAQNWSLQSGRLFTPSELRAGKAVCILGATVRKELFGQKDPLGENIRLGKFSCQVIGVLEAKGQTTFGTDQDDLIVIPIRTFQRRIAGNFDVNTIQITAASRAVTKQVQQDVEALMHQRRHIGDKEEDDFYVRDLQEIVSRVTGVTETLTALLGAVAAVSLLVGGIGIMNIMLVSVTERTREIGIRLAIGAMARDVLTQFLVESIVLASFGGVLGITLGLIGSALIGIRMGLPFIFDPMIVVIAFGFAAFVGIVFGYFPARKAAQLDPIEALRHE